MPFIIVFYLTLYFYNYSFHNAFRGCQQELCHHGFSELHCVCVRVCIGSINKVVIRTSELQHQLSTADVIFHRCLASAKKQTAATFLNVNTPETAKVKCFMNQKVAQIVVYHSNIHLYKQVLNST